MRWRVLLLFSFFLAASHLSAAKIIYGYPMASSATIVIPEEYIGMTATFQIMGYGYQGGSNMVFNMALYDPNNQKLADTATYYITAGSDHAYESFLLLYTGPLALAGNYTVKLLNTQETKRVDSYLCIIWDAAGEDLSLLKNQLTEDLDKLKNDLNGALHTETAKLQAEIDKLKNDLNDAINKHDEDQAALIRRIEDYEREINDLISELQFNLARLERQQADHLAQLEMLKVEHEKDVEMLNLKISNLDGKYAAEVANIKSDITNIELELSSLESRFLSGDQALKTQIDALVNQHNTLQNQVNIAEAQHRNDISAIQSQIEAKTLQIQTEHQADVRRLEQCIGNVDSKYAMEVSHINTEINRINSQISQVISDYKSGDAALRALIDSLAQQQNSQQNQINTLSTTHANDIAEVKNRIDTKTAQLQSNLDAESRLLQQAITNLNSIYSAAIDNINSEIARNQNAISQLERDFQAGNTDLKNQIDTLRLNQQSLSDKLDAARLAHESELALLRNEYKNAVQNLQVQHDSDMKLLQQEMKNINDTFNLKIGNITTELDNINSQLNQAIRDYTLADKDLRDRIDTLNSQYQAQQNQLNNLSSNHDRDIADLQKQINEKNAALTDKINTAVADLRMEMVTLENKHREDTRELKEKLTAAEAKLETEISKLEQADRDIYDKISELKEKQADYYARLEVIKVTHEKDMEALWKELDELEKAHKADVQAINDSISRLQAEADKLKDRHEKDVAAIRSEISAVVDKLDAEVKKIYLELKARKNEFAEYKAQVTAQIDNLQLQITMLDKAVTERLKNLENRIRYAVYSDEKLADLVKEYTKAIQDKETEIADLDLEIRDLEELGKDTTAKLKSRERKLTELLALRNELTDIEFAIKIRNDDSEFAVHEAEIEKLKAELAALRQSSGLLLQQLEEKLIETEKRLLALLEEALKAAAAENDGLRQEMEDFKALVQVFIDTLREEQLSGDATLRKLITEMDASHKNLLSQLDADFAGRLEKLKFEQDVQFENLRSAINNLSYQQRFSNSSGGSYGLPTVRDEEVPVDNRDLRVSPGASLDIH